MIAVRMDSDAGEADPGFRHVVAGRNNADRLPASPIRSSSPCIQSTPATGVALPPLNAPFHSCPARSACRTNAGLDEHLLQSRRLDRPGSNIAHGRSWARAASCDTTKITALDKDRAFRSSQPADSHRGRSDGDRVRGARYHSNVATIWLWLPRNGETLRACRDCLC